MSSPTRPTIDPALVAVLARTALAAAASDSGPVVTGCVELAGGGFAAVWRVDLADGASVVVKVGPPPGVPLLRYERDLASAEATYFRLVAEHAAAVPVPRLLQHGRDRRLLDGDWLVMTHLPGVALRELPALAGDTVRRELGAAIAHLHAVTGPRFGYTGQRAHGPTWRAAYLAMVDDVLADAVTWRVPLPAGRVRAAVGGAAGVLDAVRRPALLHFDLWDGNVLGELDATGTPRLTGLVDGERWLWGDPLLDFVSPALYRRIEDEPDHPFPAGYASVAGPVVFDGPAVRRLTLYRTYLLLLMTVEMPSRAMTGPAHAERRQLLSRLLDEHLDTLGRP